MVRKKHQELMVASQSLHVTSAQCNNFPMVTSWPFVPSTLELPPRILPLSNVSPFHAMVWP